MKLVALPCPHKARCSECNGWFFNLTSITIGTLLEAWLCSRCLGRLRSLLPRQRERAIGDRLLVALQIISVNGAVSELVLRERIGDYATNTLKSLQARALVDVFTDADNITLYRLTAAGVHVLEQRRTA